MKAILSLIISGALVVSGFGQTRNVLVGTNNTVVQPTNFWSADASNARTGLGLGTAATNPASAFQPSSATLSNLAASNGANLTNLAASNVVGTLSLGQGGTGSTNAADARTALGLETAATNPASAFQPSSSVLTNLAASNGGSLTNLTASNITGTIAISNGGSGATNAGGARTNLGLGATNDVAFNKITLPDQGSIEVIGGDLTLTGDNIFLGGPLEWGGSNSVTNAATTRTNLGLGWSALTNANASGFQTALFGTNTNPVLVNTNGQVVSPTNFWQVAPIQTLVQDFTLIGGTQTNNATNARNLYVYSLNTNLTGVSNTIILPTNAATFNGDEATVIHKGTTNTTTVVRQAGSTNNLITLSRFDESVKFIRELGQWDFYHNISFVEPIQFSGTNAAANAAASVTNLFTPNIPLVFTTNGQVVANTGTNVLTFANNVNFDNGDIQFVGTQILGNGLYIDFDDGAVGGGQITLDTNSSIAFQGAAAATTRTNLGLPLAALTNTNNANFQAAVFNTNTTPAGSAFNTIVAWMEVHVFTNGSNTSFRVPLFK